MMICYGLSWIEAYWRGRFVYTWVSRRESTESLRNGTRVYDLLSRDRGRPSVGLTDENGVQRNLL